MSIVVSRCKWYKLLPRVSNTDSAIRRRSNLSSKFPDHTVIYQLPYVRAAGLVNKLKFYQSIVTGLSLPAGVALKVLDYVSLETVCTVGIFGVATTATMFSVGFLCHNLVGYIYLKGDNQSVKISHVDFWGNRVDIDTTVADIFPLSDLPATITDPLYLNVQRYSCEDKLKLNMKLGQIVDTDKFRTVFGEPS